VNPERQTGPHPHSIVVDPGNRFALVPDLGADKVFVYRFNETSGALAPNNPPAAAVAPGSGPRHLAFHPNGRLAYLINELSSTVTAFRWDPERGLLSEFQTVKTLPDGFAGPSAAAEIVVHPNGRFLYASNRGHNSVAVFAIERDSGSLKLVELVPTEGKMPRNLAFDPSGRWLLVANHDSDNAVLFSVDDRTGRLAQHGEPIHAPNPYCIRFLW
jgi:6-phosphogluconolactonase